ncbi:glutamate receptor [Tropilaelaps mercedesae]|uniref:Glutamate receptor n=1 Tax=Tropilaelaps mercedesae TaxID=418985 RepID=A0A1V9X170_9ACAR|nr:glutamate receptor [Tropilaelaps mercedesae]
MGLPLVQDEASADHKSDQFIALNCFTIPPSNSVRFCDVDNDGDFDDVDDVGEDDPADKQRVELRTLSPGDLSGAFILLFVGLCVAFVICIGEVIFEHMTREKRDTRVCPVALRWSLLLVGPRAFVYGVFYGLRTPVRDNQIATLIISSTSQHSPKDSFASSSIVSIRPAVQPEISAYIWLPQSIFFYLPTLDQSSNHLLIQQPCSAASCTRCEGGCWGRFARAASVTGMSLVRVFGSGPPLCQWPRPYSVVYAHIQTIIIRQLDARGSNDMTRYEFPDANHYAGPYAEEVRTTRSGFSRTHVMGRTWTTAIRGFYLVNPSIEVSRRRRDLLILTMCELFTGRQPKVMSHEEPVQPGQRHLC